MEEVGDKGWGGRGSDKGWREGGDKGWGGRGSDKGWGEGGDKGWGVGGGERRTWDNSQLLGSQISCGLSRFLVVCYINAYPSARP